MKKRVINLLIILSLMFGGITYYNASNASIDVKASSNTLLTGKSITVTIKTSSSDILGALEYSLSYDSSILKLTDGPQNCSSTSCTWNTATGKDKSQEYTFTFKGIGTGTSEISVKNYRVVGYDEKSMTTKTSGSTVKVITEEDLQASYSKNNYLSSLKVKNQKLSPTFNKETTNYTLELDETIESIKITATAEDSKSSISGTGTKKVSEGENKLKVTVTAENGTKRTYVILATVKALNPINVTVDNKEYTLIKKSSNLPKLDNYELTEVEINGKKIPAYTNKITNYIVVGLKDSEGNIGTYIYDDKTDSYIEYKEYKFNGTTLQLLDKEEPIPEGYKETTIILNNTNVTAYKDNEKSEFALIYGMNVQTGKKGYYKYDSNENTVQRFNERKFEKNIINNITNEDGMLNKLLIIAVGVLSFILLVIILKVLLKSTKHRRKSSK